MQRPNQAWFRNLLIVNESTSTTSSSDETPVEIIMCEKEESLKGFLSRGYCTVK